VGNGVFLIKKFTSQNRSKAYAKCATATIGVALPDLNCDMYLYNFYFEYNILMIL